MQATALLMPWACACTLQAARPARARAGCASSLAPAGHRSGRVLPQAEVLFLLGGIGRSQGADCLASVDTYAAGSASWHTDCMRLPEPCAWGAAAALGRSIYLMGGSRDRADPASESCVVYMPDRPTPDTGDCWYQARRPPGRRPPAACCAGHQSSPPWRARPASLNARPARQARARRWGRLQPGWLPR